MAHTTEDKFRLAFSSKEDIRNAIEEKGVECGADVPFSHYGNRIRAIKTGGSDMPQGPVTYKRSSFGTALNLETIGGFVKTSPDAQILE